jgi:hypothetical protein
MAFIVRLDGNRVHGWQVRGAGRRGYASKLFSDQKYGGRENALKLAQAYKQELELIYPPRVPKHPLYRTKPQSSNRSGVNGVHYSYHYHGQTRQKQEYWAAFCPIGPYGRRYMKRFYITAERDEEEAFRLAVEYRQMWEEAAQEGEKAIKRFFELYNDGWY